jgi:hypothetical protein
MTISVEPAAKRPCGPAIDSAGFTAPVSCADDTSVTVFLWNGDEAASKRDSREQRSQEWQGAASRRECPNFGHSDGLFVTGVFD